MDDEDAPIKVDKAVKNVFGTRLKRRKNRKGPAYTQMPDFKNIAGVGSTTRSRDTSNQPYDNDYFKNPFAESLNAELGFSNPRPRMSPDVTNALSSLDSLINNSSTGLLAEDIDEDVIPPEEDQNGTP